MADQHWATILTSVLGGGAGLKLFEYLTQKNKLAVEEGRSIREDLRIEIREVREDVRRVQGELDEWKDKYFRLLEEYTELKAKCESMDEQLATFRAELQKRRGLETEIERLRAEKADLIQQIDALKAVKPSGDKEEK